MLLEQEPQPVDLRRVASVEVLRRRTRWAARRSRPVGYGAESGTAARRSVKRILLMSEKGDDQMGYMTANGRPVYLTMVPGKNGWDYCEDGDEPSIVSRDWYEQYAEPSGFGFVEV